MLQQTFASILAFTLLSTFAPPTALARQNTFTAGVSTGYDYSETMYDRDELDETLPSPNRRNKKLSIGPILIIDSKSSIDAISLDYRPSFVYDAEGKSHDMDHLFLLSGHRSLSKELFLEVSDRFVYSDDPELVEEDPGDDYNRGRKRYWTNTFNVKATYTYGGNSSFGGGYNYHILRNDDTGVGGYENYDKHTGDLFVSHRFNASWNMEGGVSYTKGLFDPPEQEVVDRVDSAISSASNSPEQDIDNSTLSNDLSEYNANATLNWVYAPAKTMEVRYYISATDYEAVLQNDSILHNLSLGANYRLSNHFSFAFGGGPSYEKTEGYKANWNYNAYLNVDYALSKRSTVSASAEKGYEQDNFSTDNTRLGRDQGLTEFTDYRLDLSYQLLKDLNLKLFVSYRDERQENIVHGLVTVADEDIDLTTTDREDRRELSSFDRDIYRGGLTLTYTFMRYWTTTLHYSFRRQNSERFNDSFDENRAYLTLSVQNDFFRW